MTRRLILPLLLFSTLFLLADIKPIKRFDFNELPRELTGKATLVPGKPGFGYAIKFDGKSYMSFPAIAPMAAAERKGVLTFECWYFRNEDDEQGYLMRQDDGFGLLNIPWDPTRLNVGIWTPKGYQSFDTEPVLSSGVWTHIGLVINKLNVKLYVNGKIVLDKTMPEQMKVSSRPVVIGAGFNGDNQEVIGCIPGMLDAVEISPVAKGADWAAAIAASTSENFEARQNVIGLPPVCNPGKDITQTAPLTWKQNNNKLTVENSFYKAEFQLKPCVKLLTLFNKFTDCNCLGTQGTDLFNVRINGQCLASSNFLTESVQCVPAENSMTLQAVTSHSYGVRMSFSIQFDATPDMTLDATMKNLEKTKPLTVTFPMLENVSIGNDFKENYYYWPQTTGWVGKSSYELGMIYGSRCWIQLTDVFSPANGGGLALSGRDTKGVPKGIITRKTKSNGKIGVDYNQAWYPDVPRIFNPQLKGCGMAFVYKPDTFAKDEELTIPTAVVSVHRGDILNPLMSYAKWSKKAFPHDPVMDSFKDHFNIVAVHRRAGNAGHMKGFQADGRMRLADDCMPDGRDHELQVAHWWHFKNPKLVGGSGEGDYDYDPTIGGKEGLIKAIREANDMGAQVVLYTCSRQVSNDSSIAVNHPDWQFQKEPGIGAVDWGSFNPCTSVHEWQDIYVEHNARLLRDLPVSGVYLDTTAEILLCKNSKHPHARHPQDDIFRLVRRAKEECRKANPKAFIMSEYIGSEAFGMYLDGCWIQTFANPHAHAFNNYDLDFARFVYTKIHYAEWGMTPDTFEVDGRRAFFNGVGAARGDLTDEQNQRYADMSNTQRECYEALAAEDPVPFVPTRSPQFYANIFPTDIQTCWTTYNKGGEQSVILPIPEKYQNLRLVELLGDRMLTLKDGAVSWKAAQYEVGQVAALTPLLAAEKGANGITITVKGGMPQGTQLFAICNGARDSKDNRQELDVADDKATLSSAEAGKGRVIIKLLKGELLLDEMVL